MRKYLPLLLLLVFCGKAAAQVPTLDKKCVAKSGTSQTFCTMTGLAANDAIIVHLYLGTLAFSSLQDCAGSSACSSTTDTFTPSIACTVLAGANVCEYYICSSALSGTVSVTVNTTGGSLTNYVEASAWKGMLSGGCLDQTGTNTAPVSSTSLQVNTAGNIGHAGEVVIGFVQVGAVPTAGTGYTAIQALDNLQTQSSNTTPGTGTPASTSWTFTSASGRGTISSWKGGIFHDTETTYHDCGNVSSCSWNHTLGTGPNPFLLVSFNIEHILAPNNPTVTSVTYGGNGMSLLASKNMGDTNNTVIYMYYITSSGGLVSGTQSVVITLSGVVGTTGGFIGGSTSFFGVAQRNPFDAAAVSTTAATGTSFSTSITTASAGAWVFDCWGSAQGFSSTDTPSAPQVLSWKNAVTTMRPIGVSYNGPIVTPGSVTDTWTDSANSSPWALMVSALKPDGSVAPPGVAQNMVPMVI